MRLPRLKALKQLSKIGQVFYRRADRLRAASRTIAYDHEVVFVVVGELQRAAGFTRAHRLAWSIGNQSTGCSGDKKLKGVALKGHVNRH